MKLLILLCLFLTGCANVVSPIREYVVYIHGINKQVFYIDGLKSIFKETIRINCNAVKISSDMPFFFDEQLNGEWIARNIMVYMPTGVGYESYVLKLK